MTVLYETTITEIGPEVADLIEGGVVILFRTGAPPELAEVSVLHTETIVARADSAPKSGDGITLGGLELSVTGIGSSAWSKVLELGHVVLNFNGETTTDRPGEICLAEVDLAHVLSALVPGAVIRVTSSN